MLREEIGWDKDHRRHALPGRVLLVVPELEYNPGACDYVAKGLQTHPAIDAVEARPLTGRVLVRFDRERMSAYDVEQIVQVLVRAQDAAAGTDIGPEATAATANGGSLTARRDDWHALSLREVLRELDTAHSRGLDQFEATRRLKDFGPNALAQAEPPRLLAMIGRKLSNPITVLLLGTGGLSLVVAQWLEAVAALSTAGMTTFLGVRQELQATKELDSLDQLAAPHAVVERGGRARTIPAEHVVPGDLILLEEGDRVPADARIVFSAGLNVDESTLTGESVSVGKEPTVGCQPDTALAERDNMVYSGTVVVRGRARAVVVATGMQTQVGWLASRLDKEREATPLHQRLQRLARGIFWVILGLGAGGTAVSVLRGLPLGTALAQSVQRRGHRDAPRLAHDRHDRSYGGDPSRSSRCHDPPTGGLWLINLEQLAGSFGCRLALHCFTFTENGIEVDLHDVEFPSDVLRRLGDLLRPAGSGVVSQGPV